MLTMEPRSVRDGKMPKYIWQKIRLSVKKLSIRCGRITDWNRIARKTMMVPVRAYCLWRINRIENRKGFSDADCISRAAG